MKLHATLVGTSLSAMIAPPTAKAEAAMGASQGLGRLWSQRTPEEPSAADGNGGGTNPDPNLTSNPFP